MTPVQIALTHSGIPEVRSALQSVRDTLISLETDSIRASQAASKKRLEIYKAEMQARKKISKEMQDVLGGGLPSTKTATVGTVGVKRDSSFLDTLKQESSIAKGFGDALKTVSTGAGMLAVGIGALAAGISLATEGLKQFGGFLVNDVVKPAFALETFATQLENATFGQLKATDVMAKGRELQVRYNLDAKTAAEAIGELADKTGNAKLSFDLIDQLAALSKGYGVDMQQLSGMAGAFYSQDSSLTAGDIGTILRTQLAQGGQGMITLKEIAGLGGSYTQNFANMAGNVDLKAATIGAAMQTGGISGKADVSIGNINAFLKDIGKVAKAQHMTGVTNEQGQVADMGEAIRQTLIKSKGNLGTLKGMGMSDPASAFITQYMARFQEGLKEFPKDLQKAAQYATEPFEKMRTATLGEADVKKAATAVMKTSGERLEQAINEIKMKMTEAMPAINGLANAFADKAPSLASAALTLTNAFVAAAAIIEKLIPETDTRAKRKMKAAMESAKLEDFIQDELKNVSKLDDQIAGAKKMHMGPEVIASLEAQKAASQKNIEAYQARQKKVTEDATAGISDQEMHALFANSKEAFKDMAFNASGDYARGTNLNHDLERGDDKAIDLLMERIRKDPKTDIGGLEFQGFSDAQREGLMKYRDMQLGKQEEAAESKKKKEAEDAATAAELKIAADALKDAADALKNAKPGEQPVGDR